MNRRAFVTGLATLLASPITVAAQQEEKKYQVGVVSLASASNAPLTPLWQAFVDALHGQNYVEGRNLVVWRAFANGRPERLQVLVDDLVSAKVDVIVTSSSRETRAAKRATSTIPIVMTLVPDPVGEGLAAGLAHPGGNVTGLTSLATGLSQKNVELLHEVVPSASRFAVVAGPGAPSPEIRRELEHAAGRLGSTVAFNEVQGPGTSIRCSHASRKKARPGSSSRWMRSPICIENDSSKRFAAIGCRASTGRVTLPTPVD